MTRRCLLNYSWDCVFLSYEKTLRLIIHNRMCWFAMTDVSYCDMTSHTSTERNVHGLKKSVCFCSVIRVRAQTRFIHLVSITIFPSKGLYKHHRISLKSSQRCNSAFIYMFSMQSANGCAFICVFNLIGVKWNCLSPLFFLLLLLLLGCCAPRPLF